VLTVELLGKEPKKLFGFALAIKAKSVVMGFGLNRKDKCIKGNAFTWKRKRAVMPPTLVLFAIPPRAFWQLQRATISFIN
jgi:hypothetical protein